MKLSRIAVVGGGIIGTAVARALTSRFAEATVTVFEKEPQLAAHQSGHAAGILDAGLSWAPDSREARLAQEGIAALVAYIHAHGLAYHECGELIVAQDTAEVERLEAIAARAQAAEIPHVRLLDRQEMRTVEPHVRGVLALHAPHTARVDFGALTSAFGADVEAAGGQLRLGTEVAQIDALGSEVRLRLALPGARESMVTEEAGPFDLVIACAGLQADRLAVASGWDAAPRIVPFHEEYSQLVGPAAEVVRGIISAVPAAGGAGAQGVSGASGSPGASGASGSPGGPLRLSRGLDGTLALGPQVRPALGREAYGHDARGWDAAGRGAGSGEFGGQQDRGPWSARRQSGSFDIADIGSTLGFSGFWKYAAKNLGAAARGARAALSPGALAEEARRYVPELDAQAVRPGRRGVRARAMDADGRLLDELVVTTHGRLTQVRSLPTTAASMSLALAEHIVDQAVGALR